MMSFWLGAAVLTLLVLAMIVVPLLRRRPALVGRMGYDLAVYRDQLAEVDRELARGTLAPDQAEAARTEISRRILVAADRDAAPAAAAAARRPWAVAASIIIGVPALGLGLYLTLGIPGLPDQPFSARADKIREMENQGQMIRNMVASLTARLEKDPSDAKGWAMLGRSLKVLGQREQAIAALRKAVALMPGDTDTRMELGSLLLQDIPQGGALPPEFVRLMAEILVVNPSNIDALYFSGVAAMQAGDSPKARAQWTKVLGLLPDGDDKAEVQRQIDALP